MKIMKKSEVRRTKRDKKQEFKQLIKEEVEKFLSEDQLRYVGKTKRTVIKKISIPVEVEIYEDKYETDDGVSLIETGNMDIRYSSTEITQAIGKQIKSVIEKITKDKVVHTITGENAIQFPTIMHTKKY